MARTFGSPMFHHFLDTPNGFDCPNQHRTSFPSWIGHDIHAVLGVNRIHVERTGSPEHGGVARSFTTGAVTGGVAAGQVGFRFDDQTTNPLAAQSSQQRFSEQISRNLGGGAFVE